MINLFKSFFQKKVKAKSTIPFTDDDLRGPIQTNRASLNLVGNWIDEDAFAASCFRYGVPDFLQKDINKPIGPAPTYTDLMLLAARKYLDEVNYLEIGVSVGKNFFQLLNALDHASFTGFDIEEINPVIERRLELKNKTEWDTPANSIKKNRSSLKNYQFGAKKVSYLSADVWDVNSWSKLQGSKFNLVFSDALHTPEAILFEFEMLVKFGLLGEKFVIVWDDLEGKMERSFHKIIRKYNEVYGIRDIYLLKINGWVGENERAHTVGIISNFTF